METTEKVVEAYVRYVKKWATIPNIKCSGQYEIDLLAIDPKSGNKYHVESGVSIPGPFSKLSSKPFDKKLLKVPVHKAVQRRTLGYFDERKFAAPEIVEALAGYGFEPDGYHKVIVSWGWESPVEAKAAALGIQLWHFASILKEITTEFQMTKAYFTDDTLRTLQLYSRALREQGDISPGGAVLF